MLMIWHQLEKLDDEELSSNILASLNYEYNSLVSSIATQVELVTFGELYSQLLAFETRLDLQNQGSGYGHPPSSANMASHDRGGFSRGCGGHGTRGGDNAGGCGCGDTTYKSKNKFPLCQLCGRTNHAVFKCYKQFDPSYMGEEKSANAANSYGVDSNWYADSRVTYHVT
jgi:hypothetical protein